MYRTGSRPPRDGYLVAVAQSPPLPGYQPPPPVPPWRQVGAYVRGLASWRPLEEPRAFLIFAQGRTGSELLVEILNSSPEVRCEGEILERRVAWPTAWAESRRRRERGRVYGFKVKPLQLLYNQRLPDMGRWLESMHGRGWRLVHLHRRNLLRQVLSNMAAEHHGWHRRTSLPRSRGPLHVDPAVVTYWMDVRARWAAQERAALAELPHETVCYEDDLTSRHEQQATLDRLAGWLGVESRPVAVSLRPTNPGRLDRLIANYAEVRTALEKGPWGPYLDPVADSSPPLEDV